MVSIVSKYLVIVTLVSSRNLVFLEVFIYKEFVHIISKFQWKNWKNYIRKFNSEDFTEVEQLCTLTAYIDYWIFSFQACTLLNCAKV